MGPQWVFPIRHRRAHPGLQVAGSQGVRLPGRGAVCSSRAPASRERPDAVASATQGVSIHGRFVRALAASGLDGKSGGERRALHDPISF
eukprot:scaffold175407_cov30-Tisochrysis_lutea.AAC.2